MNKLKTALLSTAVLSTAYLSPSVLASQLDEATVSKTDFNSVSKTFDNTAQQSTNGKGIKQIDIAIWSEENDQDDLKWYSANAITEDQASVQFHLANHGNRAGNYVTHVYTTYLDGNRSGLVLDNTKITPSAPQVSVKDGVIQLTTEIYAPSNGQVKYAIWSEENGQDDLRWYDDNGKGLTQIALKNHKGYGKYFVHTYLSQNGQMIGINGQEFTVDRPELSYQITKVNGNSFDVLIHNVPEYITSVSVPTWSNVNGQDDIKWYSASKIGEGSYTYTFYAKNHNFESGHYNVHVYGVSEVTHSLVGLATTSGIDLTFNQNLTAPTVTVQNHNADKGTLQVVIAETETSKSIASVSVAAWSEAEQKNIHWYTTSNLVDGSATVTVGEKYHHNLTGNYTVHTYIKTKDGSTIGYNLGQCAFNNTQSTTSVTATYKGTGVYGVTISGMYSNGSVKYAIWSDVNGQDDIKWYDVSVSQAVATSLINVANHSGTGTYHLHAYQSDNGKMYLLGKTEFIVKKTSYNTPYYNQKDERWGNTLYGGYKMGATGCVPTSLSMIISSLSGKEILPTMVADYLYYDTVEFNRGSQGTSGNGVLLASKHFGMTPTALGSVNELTNALKEGHYVSASVQMNKFSSWPFGTSHAIVLKGYSNGNTYVLDPYNAANNGWYPIDALWREQSTQYENIAALGHPLVKITDI